jgi:hypothetical protein
MQYLKEHVQAMEKAVINVIRKIVLIITNK